jgi:hypothetical protein
MLPFAAEALSLLAVFPRRQHPQEPPAHKCEQECQGESRVKQRTEDGREGWACPCVTGPHRVPGNAKRAPARPLHPKGEGSRAGAQIAR